MANKEFKLLSIKEEQSLTLEEKKIYYQELREYLKTRKLTNTTPGAITVAPKLKKPTQKIATTVTKAFTNKNVEWICDGKENLPVGPAIYAYNHQGLLDNFVDIPNVEEHCLILHGMEVNKLLLLCQLNTGLILVRKEDKVNNLNAKLDMIKIGQLGHSIKYFPEGTWNLSPNKLHLPMSFGIIDTAKKAGIPIVPAVHDFTYDTTTDKLTVTKIHTRFGKPITVNEEDDLIEKLHEYEEAISTLTYELIEEKGIAIRKYLTNWDYINFLKGSYKNLKLGKLNIDKERRNIFGAKDPFYLFHHINDIPFDEEGNLLETDETIRLRELFDNNYPKEESVIEHQKRKSLTSNNK